MTLPKSTISDEIAAVCQRVDQEMSEVLAGLKQAANDSVDIALSTARSVRRKSDPTMPAVRPPGDDLTGRFNAYKEPNKPKR